MEQSGRDTRTKSVRALQFLNICLSTMKTKLKRLSQRKVGGRSSANGPAAILLGEDNESLPAVSATPCFQGQLAAPSMHCGPDRELSNVHGIISVLKSATHR